MRLRGRVAHSAMPLPPDTAGGNPYRRLPPAPAPPRTLGPPRMQPSIIPAPPMVPPHYPGDSQTEPLLSVGGQKIITSFALDDKGEVMEPEPPRNPSAPIGNRNGARPYFGGGQEFADYTHKIVTDTGEVIRPAPPPPVKESLRGAKTQDVHMPPPLRGWPGGWPRGAYRAPTVPGRRMDDQVIPCHTCSEGKVLVSEDTEHSVCPKCGGAVCQPCTMAYHRGRSQGHFNSFPCPTEH